MFTSIIIPTRNRAHMVADAVESALQAEIGKPREVIVVDDGSNDDTSQVLSRFGSQIRVVQNHGQGKSHARNAGVHAACGENVLFLDDDDVFFKPGPAALEALMSRCGPEVGIVYGNPRYVKVDETNPLLSTLPPGIGASGWILPQLLRANFLQTGAFMVRRSAMLDVGGFDPAYPFVQDWDVCLRIAARWKVAYIPTEIAEVRQHSANSSRDISTSGRYTEIARQVNLLANECLVYAQRRMQDADVPQAHELAGLCLDLARRRWWEGDLTICRAAYVQALRLSPNLAVRQVGFLWRAWVPLRRPAWARPKSAVPDLPK